MKPLVQAGDVFGTENPMALGRAINAVQRFWSHDHESTYSHTGTILDSKGTTFEALWTCKRQNLFEAYAGKQVIIARFVGNPKCEMGFALDTVVKNFDGCRYPIWRVPMHLFPPLARINLFHKPVCSEMTAFYEWILGARHEHWSGANPDVLTDEWRNWDAWAVVGEGKLDG